MTPQELFDRIAAEAGFTPEGRRALDIGSNHPYSCRCATCREWWRQCGPADGEGSEGYGPFAASEIEAASLDIFDRVQAQDAQSDRIEEGLRREARRGR